MNICMVTHYCQPHIGGIEVLSQAQAIHLARDGHRVVLVSSRTAGEPADEVTQGIRIRRVVAWNLFERRIGVPYPVIAPILVRVLSEELRVADACLIHGFGFMSSFVAAWLCRKHQVPYVVIQNNSFIAYSSRLLNALQHLNDRLAGKFVVRHAAEVLAVSRQTQAYARLLGRNDVGLLPNAVDTHTFEPAVEQQMARRSLGLPSNTFIILTVGRLTFKRAADTLLAAAELLADDPQILFVVVGNGLLRPSLERFIRQRAITNCRFTGAVPNDALPQYYQAADLFVLSSRTGEGLPVAVLEAWACALPLIATAIGWQTGVVENGRNALLIPACAPEHLAQAIRWCIENPASAQRIGEAGRATVLRHFSMDAHVSALLATLYRATEKPLPISARLTRHGGIGCKYRS
jgi:glycosyltransferase involved in cell wall biosynthesis